MTVLLLNMPFANLAWPNLGLSLLKSALVSRGIDCDLDSPCFDLAERIGPDFYSWIADGFAFVLGGEAKEVILWTEPLTEDDRADFFTVAGAIPPFLDDYFESVSWDRYRIVGFSLTFQQTLASLALARRIKATYPDIVLMFGGAACEGGMGAALIELFPEIDYVFLGEADVTFPEVVRRLLDERDGSHAIDLPPGVLSRSSLLSPSKPDSQATGNESTRCSARPIALSTALLAALPAGPVPVDLDRLPFPDFDDYFSRLAASPLREEIDPLLFFETSRGCWWGERNQCAFCGLNGSSLKYRFKTPARAVEELQYLCERYGIRKAAAADNIFANEYFTTFLPALKESGLGLRFEYEMRSNLTKAQCMQLVDAGLAAAQIGIETFSTPLLKLLRKGTLARHNLQILKWFTAVGIEIKWNVLYGFPGEPTSEYVAMTRLVPLLIHLKPPLAVGPVRADRFGPYHSHPEQFGIANIRPHRAFGHLYPFDEDALSRLAYFHEFDYAGNREPLKEVADFLDRVEEWRLHAGHFTFQAFDRADGVLLLTDTRPCAATFQRRLGGWERLLYLECDTAQSLDRLCGRFVEQFGEKTRETILATLESWIAEKIMINIDDYYFSLATLRTDMP